MKIRWFGHSAFSIEDEIKIIADPYISGSYNGAVGYDPIDETADIVIASHKHDDHYGLKEVKGDPKILEKEGEYKIFDAKIELLKSFHDQKRGNLRGDNLISIITFDDGIRVVHFGDQGCMPDQYIINKVKNANVVMIPIGGTFTVDYREAKKIIKKITPNIIIPMHYKTEKLGFNIDTVDNFLTLFDNVEKAGNVLERNNFEDDTNKLVILDYTR